MSRAPKFDWDDANTGHIARHGVTPAEVEQAFASDPLVVLAVQKRSGEERVLCAGLTDAGRALQFVYTRRSGGIRVVTAHVAKRKVREKL
ncbi:MAG: BrnT family toxin [Bryobacteraceae bacterium]